MARDARGEAMRVGIWCASALLMVGALVDGSAMAKAFPLHMPRIPKPDADHREGDSFFDLRAEQRVRFIRVDPLEVNGVVAEDVEWTEQRLRLQAMVARVGVAAVHLEVDVLDGVLYGDNGQFGSTPAVTSGL